MVANINDPTGKSGLTVSAVRTSEWSANNFGTYKSYTLWGGFGKDGWIIQFNTLVSTYWPCGFIGPPFTSTTTFYEAWMVLDSEVYAPCPNPMVNMSAIKPLPWTDSWNSAGQPGVPNLITETITSNAVFVAAETPEDPPTKDFFQYFSCVNPISKIIAGSKLNAVWPSAGTLNWQNGIQTLNYKANCCIKNPGLPTFQRTPSGSATLLKGCR